DPGCADRAAQARPCCRATPRRRRQRDLSRRRCVVTMGPVSEALADKVSAQLAALTSSDLHQLRVQWRKLMRSEAPAHLTRSLLLRILAYKVQELAYG